MYAMLCSSIHPSMNIPTVSSPFRYNGYNFYECPYTNTCFGFQFQLYWVNIHQQNCEITWELYLELVD